MVPWFIFAFGGALFLALSEVIGKKVLMHEHALEFTMMRSMFIFAASLVLIPFVRWELITPPVFFLIFIASIIATAGLLFRMKAVRHLEVSYVSPLMNISPLFLLIFSFFLLHEQPRMTQIAGVLLTITGTYLLQGHRHKRFLDPLRQMIHSRHVHHLVFALVALSFLQIIDKFSVSKLGLGAPTYLFLVWLLISAELLVLEWVRFDMGDLKKDFREDGKWLALAGALFFISILLGLKTLELAPVSLAIPIRRTSALFSIVLGGRMFHEKNIKRKLSAATLMVLGAALIIV